MFDQSTVTRIRDMVSTLTGFGYQGTVTAEKAEGLRVKGNAQRAVIAAESIPALARGFMRLFQELKSGKETVEIAEEKRFDTVGCQLDCSRNAVMKVSSVKKYMDACCAMGMNCILLYLEDTYEVPEYPYFGYLRGKYTQAELKEMDDYAASLGMELIISMQTLAHLEQFLQWPKAAHLRDNTTCLLIDEEETYEFIEAEIRALRSCLRTKRLHIGMDEAHGVGMGRYYDKHGPTDRFELLARHVRRVCEICEKYGFKPMMWSDMFFRLGSKTNEYYDKQADIPQSVIDSLPPVDMCYWDYYHTDEELYDHMLKEHARMGQNTIFAGGVWTWSGFLPQVDYTWETMEPGLRMCAKHKVKTVFATMWGDDGNETNHFLALSQVALFSEFCWRGDACTREDVCATGEFVSGLATEAYNAFSLFYPGAVDERPGKKLVYCDLLYPLGPKKEDVLSALERAKKAYDILAPYYDRLDCRYARDLFAVVGMKAQIISQLRDRYLAGDKAYLAKVANETIPLLVLAYGKLHASHKELWERDYKRIGWEVMALRYSAVIGRLVDAQDALKRYVNGQLDTIEELNEPVMDTQRWRMMKQYSFYVSPMFEI